jgi:hypothetical protein
VNETSAVKGAESGGANYHSMAAVIAGASAYEARLHGSADGSPVTTRHEQTTALAWLVYKVR